MKPFRWIGMVAVAILVLGAVASQALAVVPDNDPNLRANGQTFTLSDALFSQPDAQAGTDSCDIMAWRDGTYKKHWYNYAGKTSTNVPILAFRYEEGGGNADTLIQFYVHSLCEKTNTISQMRLYREYDAANDADTSCFWSAGDSLIATVNVVGPFQTNDSILFSGLNQVIAGNAVAHFYLVVNMNSAGINDPTYDETGVMVEIRTERMMVDEDNGNGRVWGPNAPIRPNCPVSSPANNAYSIIIDYSPPPCDTLYINNIADGPCDNACDGGQTILSLGDSLLINLDLDLTDVNPATDSCATGWPKVFVREFTTNAGAQTMGRYKGSFWNTTNSPDDANWAHFAYVAEFDSTNGPGPFDLMNIPTSPAVNNPIDVNAGFYWLVAELKDVQGNVGRCSTLVNYKIDTKKPATSGRPADWTLWYDANGNGIVNPGDTVRLSVDMSNEPFGEICQATTILYGWGALGVDVPLTLLDQAGDRKFEVKYEVVEGVLDTTANSQTAWIHVFDDACNNDSVMVTLPNAVDNQPLNTAAWNIQFLRLSDTDQNGCLKIGESVRIDITNATDPDLDSIFANLLMAGLGDMGGVTFDRHTLNNLGGGHWQLDWVLGEIPQDSAIDYAANNANAIVYLYVKDDAANTDTVTTGYLEEGNGGYNIDTEYPLPVEELQCESQANAVIQLSWNYTDPANDIDRYQIYWDAGTGTINYGAPLAEIAAGPTTWTTDGTVVLTDGQVYKFDVWSIDDCGNVERDHPTPVACQADGTPPIMCIFQPEAGGIYCDNFFIYVCPQDEASNDVSQIAVQARLKDNGAGNPGPWINVGGASESPNEETCFSVELDASALDALVGPDTSKVIQLAILTWDEAGNQNTETVALATCGAWEFTWSTHVLTGEILSINGDPALYQDYCDIVGWTVYGSNNPVEFCVEGGIPPYKVEFFGDDDENTGTNDLLYSFDNAPACTTLVLDATNWAKGLGTVTVTWEDACGATATAEVNVCVPDSVAPCAEIINPVDGKCIRRSRSDKDPIEGICAEIDPLANCVDPDNVLKVDFQWSTACCPEGEILGYDFFLRESTYTEGGGSADSCDTSYFSEEDGDPASLWGLIKRIHCYYSTQGEEITVYIPDSAAILCEDTLFWNTFSIVPGPAAPEQTLGASAQETGDVYCADPWDNSEDLAWITESGTNIWLRAVIYDDQGNKFITPCVQVCIDIDTPPLCMDVESPCGYTAEGWAKYPSDATVTLEAVLDLAQANIDDIESVEVWYKDHSLADRPEHWNLMTDTFIDQNDGSNKTVWRHQIRTNKYFEPNRAYDVRLIAHTLWGTVSYDMDGNGDFDANTFDTTGCDMQTWYIDGDAPNVGIDTVWTEIDGETIVQPNVSCRLSDPRGWAYMQYGQTITVQPAIWALSEASDVAKIEYRLWDGECSICECSQVDDNPFVQGSFGSEECQSKVLAIREGENALNPVTLDPSIAPFVNLTDGYQAHVLTVTVWDECGNSTTDCVTLYILDVTPTDAVIVDPMNHDVFCQDHSQDGGGIEITATSLLNDRIKQVIFYYRPVGEADWVVIDSAEVGRPGGPRYGTTGEVSVLWYPHALGLPDGAYELKAVAMDYSLNKQTTEYITTVHLSCATPTVTMEDPTPEDGFLGNCAVELTAQAIAGDEVNDITEVCFYWMEWTDDEPTSIGCDYNPDGSNGQTMFNYHWLPSDDLPSSGHYYLWATATNKAGVTVESEKVLVKYDGSDPWARVIEVAGDGSDGGSSDPTVVVAGDNVDIYAVSRDVDAGTGYGPEDNCGVDSVIIYVYDDEGTALYGKTASVDNNIDSLYMATWPTAGWPNGTYRVRAHVFDCACNDAWSSYWYVKVINSNDYGTLAIDPGVEICDTLSICGQDLNISLTVPENQDVSSVQIWWQPVSSSDVYDQWSRPSPNNGVLQDNDGDGVWEPIVDFSTANLAEGVYRVRAVVTSSQGQKSDDNNGDGKFDDFSFDPSKSHMMLVKVDCSVTNFSVAVDKYTIQKGTNVEVTVTPDEACDVDEVCYGLVAMNGNAAVDTCMSDLVYSFDPVDSGLVTLKHGIWHGPVQVTVSDALGNSETWTDENDLYVLDISGNQAMVVYPTWGDFLSQQSVTLAARKLTSGTVSNLKFFFGPATGAGTEIAGTPTQDGDEYTLDWDLTDVPAGVTYLWTSAATDKRVPVTVVKLDNAITLKNPVPMYTRTVFNETLNYVGGRVDLCVDTASVNQPLMDSVVFAYRFGDAPGVPYDPDPELGWVRINSDRYGSLCVDWFTDQDPYDQGGCRDGYYSLAAWVYYKGGIANHSNIVNVYVDNTDPYTEIVDIDGDETFGDCHEIIVTGQKQQVKFSAVAVDDRSCAGATPEFNSGAMTLQFFIGQCEGIAGGCADIVWVVDGSGSMGDDQAQIAQQAQSFFLGLGGLDFRMGVLAYTDVANPVGTDGIFKTGGANTGQFTTDLSTFQTMVTAVGDTGSGTENGLTALQNALQWYPWRENCSKVLILVTDENADDIESFPSIVPNLIASQAQINTVFNFADSSGYSVLAPLTHGAQLDITSSWGANLTALASQITGGGGAGGDVGIIWGKQVALTDGQADAFAYWDPTGVPEGTYCAWTVVTDQVGNQYQSDFRQVCIKDHTPPIGYIAGFGVTTDEHMNKQYYIMGRTWDQDVDRVQFQWRSGTAQTDWTGIGLAQRINGDSTCWLTTWNPCVWTGTNPTTLEFRMVPTDASGNEDFDAQPIFKGSVNNCKVTPVNASGASAAFEDKRFENLGIVNVQTNATQYHHSMLAFYADMKGNYQVEKVALYVDQGDDTHMAGSFDDSRILTGGTGWFWTAYNDMTSKTTYLTNSMLQVYHVDPDVALPGTVTDTSMGARVNLEYESLTGENGVVMFPARIPRVALMQNHIQVWPYDANGYATALRLTTPIEGFNEGTYALVTIAYDKDAVTAAGLSSSDLAIGWWDGDHWNTTDGIYACGDYTIGNGVATFCTDNLHGVYAVISAGRQCNTGAVSVSVDNFAPSYNGYTGNWPVIYSTVKSNLEFENGNADIDPYMITVTLDGVTIMSNGDDARGWATTWDNISGRLVTRFVAQRYYDDAHGYYYYSYYDGEGEYHYLQDTEVLPLGEGEHTVTVRGFNKAGFCQSATTTFTVDVSEPNVFVVNDHVCNNPTFWFTVNDQGSGVNWDSVYVDVYDITGSEFSVVPRDKLIHTETPDAWDDAKKGDTVSFTLTDEIANGRRLRIVIYDGVRTLYHSTECGCEYWDYDHDADGIPDMVGNHTEIVEEDFTVNGTACIGGGLEDVGVEIAGSSSNPFDPWAGEMIEFSLNGFALGGGTVKATVYDLTGEKVATLSTGAGAAKWNGRTDNGDIVAEGVYLVHFQRNGGTSAGSNSQALKVVVKRAD